MQFVGPLLLSAYWAFWAAVCKTVRLYAIGPLSVLSVCNVGVLWPNGWNLDGSRCPGNIVLDGDPAPPAKGAQQFPHFLAHVHYGQTAGWIKMPLSTKVGLGPGHILYWTLPQKGGTAPNFRPMSVVVKRLMDQDATWCGGRP